jgi:putative membrane protein
MMNPERRDYDQAPSPLPSPAGRRSISSFSVSLRLLYLFLCLASSSAAWAHGVKPDSAADLWQDWSLEPGVVIPLLLSAWLYAIGLHRLWGKTRIGRGVHKWEAGCYAAGWFALVIALVSPLHPWGQVLFSAHMTQHEVLMLVAAPLLVLGRPLAPFLKALPSGWARHLASLGTAKTWRHVWEMLTQPFVAWLIHGVILWTWHAPALFEATLESEWVHALQHLSFLGSALLFWWAVLHGRERAMGYGLAVLYLFTTALHNGLLGALLTFARSVWYPAYASTTIAWGLTPLEDQQLGGLIMWVPAGLVYVLAGLVLFANWLRTSGQRVSAAELVGLSLPTDGAGDPTRAASHL